MKARLRETGEIVNIIPNPRTPNTYYCNDVLYGKDNLDIIIDWEQRTYEVAKSLFTAYNPLDKSLNMSDRERIVKMSVFYADMFIKELKNNGTKENL